MAKTYLHPPKSCIDLPLQAALACRMHLRPLLILALSFASLHAQESKIPDDTPVYWSGEGKRVHVEGCRRLTKDPAERAKMQKMTAGEARAKDLPPCSRCPGSALNQERNAEAEKQKQEKQRFALSSLHRE